MYDVLCYGALCADHRIWLPRYPQPGEGLRAVRDQLTAGGNALLEALALAAWGNRVVLMGDHLGADAEGALLWSALSATAIERDYLVHDPTARTPRCHILITPDGQRTIVALRTDNPPFTPPPADLLAQCRLVSLTRYGPHTDRVAQLVRAAGARLVIGDATRPDDPWTAHADVIVTSAALLNLHTPASAIETQMSALHHQRGAAVVVTDGPRPVRALWRETGELRTWSCAPPPLAPADTTGAGDRFRAALVHGLLRDWPWPRLLDFACIETAAYLQRALGDAQ